MLTTNDTQPDLLTLEQAATLIGKSVSWVRTLRAYGPLEPGVINGRQAVTAQSVAKLLADRPVPQAARAAVRRTHLRLVVDNTRP
ncbi:hypothetical protein [Kaistia sp. UC242_56]|uniref:hypothetical protein n=1 Tax=Kaistia sp. UC242_56 TaxID=3374625 RepID=UPI003788462A